MIISKDFKNALAEMFYPHRCIVCDEVIADEGFCELHKDAIKPNTQETCFGCGVFKNQCECKRFVYHFDGIVAPYINDERAREAVYKLKFKDGFDCVNIFSAEMANVVSKSFGVENIDFVCCVPTTDKNLLYRGFNQSEFFAVRIAERLNKPFRSDILYKRETVKTQHSIKNIRERFLNVRDGYYTKRKIKGKNVLLVDDIKTSGASLDECARQLKFAGADRVYVVTAVLSSGNGSAKKREDT